MPFCTFSPGHGALSTTITLTVDHQDCVICRRLGACEGKSQCLAGVPQAHLTHGGFLPLQAPSSHCCPAQLAAVMGSLLYRYFMLMLTNCMGELYTAGYVQLMPKAVEKQGRSFPACSLVIFSNIILILRSICHTLLCYNGNRCETETSSHSYRQHPPPHPHSHSD